MQDILITLFWELGVKAGLLVLLGALAVRWFANRQAGLASAIWRSVLLAIVLLLPLHWVLPSWQIEVFQPASSTLVAQSAGDPMAATKVSGVTAKRLPLVEFGLLVYVLGGLAGLAGLLTSLWRLGRWTAAATLVKERRACDLLGRLGARMQVDGQIQVLWSWQVDGPLSWGFRPATILLPQGHYSADDVDLEHAIAHELAHLSRGDWAWHLLAQIVNVLCWWNPLVRLAVRRHGEQVEQDCDRLAVRHCDSVRSYARSLLAAACSANQPLAMSMAENTSLGRRIESLINLDNRSMEMQSKHKLICALVMATVLMPLAACSLTQAAEPEPTPVPVADGTASAVIAPAAPVYPSPSDRVSAAPSIPDVPAPSDLPAAPDSVAAPSEFRPVLAPAPAVPRAPLADDTRVYRVAHAEAASARAKANDLRRQVRPEANQARVQANDARLAARDANQQARLKRHEVEQQARIARQKATEAARLQQRGQERQQEVNAALKLELTQMQSELAATRIELEAVQQQLNELKEY